MTVHTTPRARAREDRAGDPLDRLVNLFDLGIVLAVAFLLAARSSMKLTSALIHHTAGTANEVAISTTQTTQPVNRKPYELVVGHGIPDGQVYRLTDGQLINVAPTTTITTR